MKHAVWEARRNIADLPLFSPTSLADCLIKAVILHANGNFQNILYCNGLCNRLIYNTKYSVSLTVSQVASGKAPVRLPHQPGYVPEL